MKGLLIKDFMLMKTQKNFFLIIIAIAVFMSIASSDSSFVIGFLGCIGSIFTLSSISYDEFDNGNAFLFSLPITRKSYALEKYSFGLIVGCTSWLFGTVINMIFSLFKNTTILNEILLTALLVLPIIIILLSVMIPFQLKFGGEKGRIAILGAVGIVAVIGVIIVKISDLLHIDLDALLNNLPTLSISMILVIALLASLLLMLLSIRISISIMNKKEF